MTHLTDLLAGVPRYDTPEQWVLGAQSGEFVRLSDVLAALSAAPCTESAVTVGVRVKQDRAEKERRHALTHHDQMLEAEASCVPCKLCGGKAKITDAGPGYGYNINCENWMQRQNECFQGGTRISGWAYNVADRWNELNAPQVAALTPAPAKPEGRRDDEVRRAALREAAALCDQYPYVEGVKAAILDLLNKETKP